MCVGGGGERERESERERERARERERESKSKIGEGGRERVFNTQFQNNLTFIIFGRPPIAG